MLSQNEIKLRSAKFSEDWKSASYEKGETQTFNYDNTKKKQNSQIS